MEKLLQQYEESFAEVNWKAMTGQQKLDFVFRWFELKIFDAKLNKATGQINAENQEAYQKQQKQAYIESLKEVGFNCDNGVEDYEKLFNRPEIFGDRWQQKAEEAQAQSTSIDDFINLTIQYL